MKALRTIPMVFFSTLAALSVSCSDDVVVTNGQEVYFEIHYTNQAWGNQFKGFLIDKEGQVRTYDKPASWNDIERSPALTGEQMEANMSQTTVTTIKIDATEFEKHIDSSRKITGDSFSKPVNGGADLGLTRFYSYAYNADAKTYTATLLRQTGDVIINNQDPRAKEVADWLAKVMDEVY
jgi:hypothetical protein